uniref:Putative secreted protein n=1 Tax=Anopheles marajoara TaxID=58244 RepID=A0A2M4CBT0_9DIPT
MFGDGFVLPAVPLVLPSVFGAVLPPDNTFSGFWRTHDRMSMSFPLVDKSMVVVADEVDAAVTLLGSPPVGPSVSVFKIS